MGFRISGGSYYSNLAFAGRVAGSSVVTVRPGATGLRYSPAAAGVLSFVSASYSGYEGTVVQFSVTRQNGASGTIAVDWVVSAGEGQPTPAAGTITWNTAEAGAKSVAVTLGLVSANRTRTITLSNPRSLSGGATPTLSGETASITITNDIVVPGAVTLSASPTSDSVVALTAIGGADTQSGFKEFVFYRSPTGATGTFIEIARQASGLVEDTGLSPGTTYFYRVDALDKAGNSTSATASTTTVGGTSSVFPLSVSDDGRYLVDKSGAPFLLYGDTAWSLVVQSTNAYIEQYLTDRATRGFNAIMINAIEHWFSSQSPEYRNVDGVAPFQTMTDFDSAFVPAFWNRLDLIINTALSLGVAVIMTPAYAGYPGSEEGWDTEILAASNSALYNYGVRLGQRYQQPNVIWSKYGDQAPSTQLKAKYEQLFSGILSVLPNAICTGHTLPASPVYPIAVGTVGFKLNAAYPGAENVYAHCAAEYARTPAMPFVMLEAVYEQERATVITAQGLRRQFYQSFLSGARGHFFGNNPIWHGGAAAKTLYPYTGDKISNLNSVGAQDQARGIAFFKEYATHALVPQTGAQLVTSSLSSNDNRICPALTPDGALGMVYRPNSGSSTINLGAMTPTLVQARFFNPADGTYSDVSGSPFANTGTQSINWPGERVLVLNAASGGGGGGGTTISHGDTVTRYGALGAVANASPIVVADDFSLGTLGALVRGNAGKFGGSWDSNSNGVKEVYYSDAKTRGVQQRVAYHNFSASNTDGMNAALRKNINYIGDFVIDWWHMVTLVPSNTNPAWSRNYKTFRFYESTDPNGGNNFCFTHLGPGTNVATMFFTRHNNVYVNCPLYLGEWAHYRLRFRIPQPYANTDLISFTRARAGQKPTTIYNGTYRGSQGTNMYPTEFALGDYWARDAADGIASNPGAAIYTSSVTIRRGWSSVILGNAATLADCTITEEQPVTERASDGVTYKANVGLLPPGPAWEHILDDNHNVVLTTQVTVS